MLAGAHARRFCVRGTDGMVLRQHDVEPLAHRLAVPALLHAKRYAWRSTMRVRFTRDLMSSLSKT
jgi:hypothetical protein